MTHIPFLPRHSSTPAPGQKRSISRLPQCRGTYCDTAVDDAGVKGEEEAGLVYPFNNEENEQNNKGIIKILFFDGGDWIIQSY